MSSKASKVAKDMGRRKNIDRQVKVIPALVAQVQKLTEQMDTVWEFMEELAEEREEKEQ